MRIVHVQTTVQTIFGLLDDDGNVIPQQPIVSHIQRFSEDAFAEAQRTISDERDAMGSLNVVSG